MIGKEALVLLSGGQDSTTCLLWALNNFESVKCVNISYGQRHIREKIAAAEIAGFLGVEIIYLTLDILQQIGGSALLNESSDISAQHEKNSNLPASFVPGRNIFFITSAAALAFKWDIEHIVTGVCQTDYSGYPDCRQETITSLQATLNLAMEYDFMIHTPLMYLTKAQTVEMAINQAPVSWKKALSLSHTCYEGAFPPCGECPACKLRIKGFEEAGVEDPIFARIRGEFNA